jgi:hypothetical protein
MIDAGQIAITRPFDVHAITKGKKLPNNKLKQGRPFYIFSPYSSQPGCLFLISHAIQDKGQPL